MVPLAYEYVWGVIIVTMPSGKKGQETKSMHNGEPSEFTTSPEGKKKKRILNVNSANLVHMCRIEYSAIASHHWRIDNKKNGGRVKSADSPSGNQSCEQNGRN